MNDVLTSENVEAIFRDCLFKEEELVDGKPLMEPVKVEGIRTYFGFHPERLRGYTEQIQLLINELPEEFDEGWSFLNLCVDREHNQWTGLHQICEQLMVLAMGVGLADYTLPRESWSVFPSGLPYIRFHQGAEV